MADHVEHTSQGELAEQAAVDALWQAAMDSLRAAEAAGYPSPEMQVPIARELTLVSTRVRVEQPIARERRKQRIAEERTRLAEKARPSVPSVRALAKAKIVLPESVALVRWDRQRRGYPFQIRLSEALLAQIQEAHWVEVVPSAEGLRLSPADHGSPRGRTLTKDAFGRFYYCTVDDVGDLVEGFYQAEVIDDAIVLRERLDEATLLGTSAAGPA